MLKIKYNFLPSVARLTIVTVMVTAVSCKNETEKEKIKRTIITMINAIDRKEWSSDKFAVMSWEDWLTSDPMPTAKNLKIPTLMIHSDGAVLPSYTKRYFEQIAAKEKKLHWINSEAEPPFEQFDFFEQLQRNRGISRFFCATIYLFLTF